MRSYKLASAVFREFVDLRDYKKLIVKLIHKEVPDADVIVEKSQYFVTPDLTRGQAIRIGRAIASSKIGEYTMFRPSLFVGKKVE